MKRGKGGRRGGSNVLDVAAPPPETKTMDDTFPSPSRAAGAARDTKRRRTEFAAAPARRRGVPCRRCSRSFKHSHCGHCNRAFKNPEACQ